MGTQAFRELGGLMDSATFQTVLLHGITGSGKTEIYLRCIQRALVLAQGNISTAAKLLGVTRPTLYDLIRKYDLNTDESMPSNKEDEEAGAGKQAG